jgi:hypothetical protein
MNAWRATVQLIAVIIGTFRGFVDIINLTNCCADWLNRFGSTGCGILRVSDGTAPGPYHIDMRYRAAVR